MLTRSAIWSATSLRRRRPTSSRGRMRARMSLALAAVSDLDAPPGRRMTRSRWMRHTAWVRSPTSSLRLLESKRSVTVTSSGRTTGRSVLCRPTRAIEWASVSSVLRPLPPANTRTSAARRVDTSSTVSPSATKRWARYLPTPLQPSIAHVRGRHWRQNVLSSRNPPAVFANCWRARTLPLLLITTTAFIRLCGSTPITTLATRFLLHLCRRRKRGGQRYFEPGIPLSSHSPQDGDRRELSINEPHARGGQPVREPPVGHLAPRLACPGPQVVVLTSSRILAG